MLQIAINGASGRMGLEITKIIQENPSVYTQIDSDLFKDLVFNKLMGGPLEIKVVVDFSVPSALPALLEWCLQNKKPLVIGTTGFNQFQLNQINIAAKSIPILYSPNMSLSVNVLFKVAALIAEKLANFEVEITESHHRYKKDAPSGTALALGKVIASARGLDFKEVANFNRTSNENTVRPQQEIGFSVIRGGDIVGKHTANFITDGEELTITSEITNRRSFAHGALLAAKFLTTQQPGLFSMTDVLNLKEIQYE